MKGFYEKFREEDSSITVQRNTDHVFKAHYHVNVEVLAIKKGNYKITINGKNYILSDGDVAVIDSYDIHSYEENSACNDDCVFIFPPVYTNYYTKLKNGLKSVCPIIRNEKLAEALLEIGDRIFAANTSEKVISSGANLFFALISDAMQYTTSDTDTDNLVRNVLDYVYNNYRKNIDASSVAKALGYSREHLSREFKKFTNSGIKEYINALRLDYVEYGVKRGKKLSELVYEAGFNSMQTYYRHKKQKT